MPIDITGNIDRFEGGDTRQFTMTGTVTAPDTAEFVVFNTDGTSLALAAVQSGESVQNSGAVNLGLFYFNRVLPDTVGYYTTQWTSWDANSLPYILRSEFEIIRTLAQSFFSYGNVSDVLRTARQMFGRADITQRDIQDYMEPADDWINGKLGVIFTVPVTPAPPILRDMVKVYALCNFYSDRYNLERQDTPPAIVRRKEAYDEFLDEIVEGNAILHTQSGTVIRYDPQITSTTDDFKPIFDHRDWEVQRIDPDIRDRDKADDT